MSQMGSTDSKIEVKLTLYNYITPLLTNINVFIFLSFKKYSQKIKCHI